jgi:hypothetical protein
MRVYVLDGRNGLSMADGRIFYIPASELGFQWPIGRTATHWLGGFREDD